MTIQQALVIGIGAPIVTALLAGIAGKGARKEYARYLGVSMLATFGTAAAVSQFMPSQPAVAAAAPCNRVGKSVSDVTVRLGRYAGGIDYPGQLRGTSGATSTYTNGDLVYID